MFMGQQIQKDQLVWFRNDQADENDQDNSNKPFYAANILKVSGENLVVKLTPEEQPKCKIQAYLAPQFEVPLDKTMEYSQASEQGIADMVEIDELNHATLLFNLFKRYTNNEIYTYVGPILLAMNPFKGMDHLYTEEKVQMYKRIISSKQPWEERKGMPPHIFAITAMAYKLMIDSKQKQAIVISGESGSGKTESAKCAMKFLTKLSAKEKKDNNEPGIEQKILDTNPVLESFGNSKTVRNNNSSRFGKYVILYFSQQKGEILGARVKNYLLEKSRVVGPAAGERNYHVFYHILRGASLDLLSELGLINQTTGERLDIQDFNFLKSGADVDQKIINDPELFVELANQFNNLGFTKEEQMAIWKITATSLHLGEISFDDSTYDENGKPCKIVNMDRMMMIGRLLGLNTEKEVQDLIAEIVNKPSIPGSSLRAPLKKNECIDARDSLAKCLYDNLFNWLVERMNLTILPENEGEESFKNETKTIGLLDIFGFENFKENNFEQMCINYVNEKLHKLYISAIFDAEKFELRSEGLGDRVNQLKYPDLTSLDVIKLLDEKLVTGSKGSGKVGIFNIVNDCSTQKPRPTWEVLTKRIDDMHKASNVYAKEKVKEKFKIRHSAKDVIYTVKTFIERNVDEISSSLENCINTKTQPIIANIFQGIVKPGQPKAQQEEEKKGAGGKGGGAKKTIWHKFSAQMQDLMMELAEPLLDFKQDAPTAEEPNQMQQAALKKGVSTQPNPTPEIEPCSLHFIRCIKPNDFKIKDTFIHAMCLQQITYMGVLESIDVKQKNYPYRKSFEEFYQRYELLSPLYGTTRYDNMPKNSDFRGYSKIILDEALRGYGQEFYAIGKTKMLMRNELVALLEKAKLKAREKRDLAAQMIKRSFSLFLGYANTQQNKQKMVQVQSYLRAKRQEIIDKRAKLFYEKALVSILKFKTEKRKDYEMKASQVLTDVYKKHMFRNQLAKSLRDRQKVVQSIANYAVISRLRKYYICYTLSRALVDKAFTIGKSRAEERSVRLVQRLFRGFQARERKMNVVVSALKAKENLKLHVAAKRVQKRLRGMIVRTRMRHLHLTAQRIQGFIRMKWYREFYLKLRSDVVVIQRSVRRFLARRDIIKQRLLEYLGQEINIMKNVKQIENYQLFGGGQAAGQGEIGSANEGIGGGKSVHTPYSLKKIQVFIKTVDMHLMTDLSEVYSYPWSAQWNKLSRECIQGEFPIMHLQVGATHTLAVTQKSKLYCWGWNDNGQCAKNTLDFSEIAFKQSTKPGLVQLTESQESLQVKQIVAVQDRCFVLLQDSQDILAWGSNEKGQLGLGTYDDEFQPRKIEFFSKLQLKVSSIAAGGDMTLASCENGEGYAWPFQRAGTTYSLPVKMPFSEKIKISRVSCGYNFGFFISSQGLVYALGKDNSEGQLGLGHVYPRDVPDIIASLKDIGERIDSLECGYKHAIAKSTLGKIYTWGWGAKGQLGHGHYDSELTPRLLVIEKNKHKEKVIQVAAGFSHTLIMLETNRELLWFGTSGQLNQQSRPIQMRLSDTLPELFPEVSLLSFATGQQIDFAVIKILSTWSKSLSLSNLLIADLRQVNNIHPWNKIQSTLQQLATKWDHREVMPPYIDTVSGMFNASMMKIPGAKTQQSFNKNVKDKNIANRTNQFQSSRLGNEAINVDNNLNAKRKPK